MLNFLRRNQKSLSALLAPTVVFLTAFLPGIRGASSPLASLIYHVTETTTTSEGLIGPSGFGEFVISVGKKTGGTVTVAADDGSEAIFDLSPMLTEVADAATIWDGKRYARVSFSFEPGLLTAGQSGYRELKLTAVTDGIQRTLCAKLSQTASRVATGDSSGPGSDAFTGSLHCQSKTPFTLNYTGTLDQSGSVKNIGLRFKIHGHEAGRYVYAASGSDKLSIPFPLGLIFATHTVARMGTKT